MSRDVCGICWCPYEDGRCGCDPKEIEKMILRPETISRKAAHNEAARAWEGAPATIRLLAGPYVVPILATLQAMGAEVQVIRADLEKIRRAYDDEALLKQALEALETPIHEQPLGMKMSIIAALRERLK
jgi:hypothetical protein